MRVHVLLYKSANNEEGIHSLEIKDKTVVLMFEDIDDAVRYCGLLEAQDFPVPNIEALDINEVELFCKQAGYEARLVVSGFIPKNEEERLYISPPSTNKDVENWPDEDYKGPPYLEETTESDSLEDIKKRLEGLL